MPDMLRGLSPATEVPSKVLSRLPEALICVCVGLKGIKSICKTALDGAASNRVAKATTVTPQSFALIMMNFTF